MLVLARLARLDGIHPVWDSAIINAIRTRGTWIVEEAVEALPWISHATSEPGQARQTPNTARITDMYVVCMYVHMYMDPLLV
jgi:hypothetical protein